MWRGQTCCRLCSNMQAPEDLCERPEGEDTRGHDLCGRSFTPREETLSGQKRDAQHAEGEKW